MIKKIFNLRIFWTTWVELDNGDSYYPYIRHWNNIFLAEYHTIRKPLDEEESFKKLQKDRLC